MKKENKRKTKDVIKCIAKFLIVELLIVLFFGRLIYVNQPVKKEDTYNVTETIQKVEIIETWSGRRESTKYRLEIHTPNGYYLYPGKYVTTRAEEIKEKLMSCDEVAITVYEHHTRTLREYMSFGSVTIKKISALQSGSEVLYDFDEYNLQLQYNRTYYYVFTIILSIFAVLWFGISFSLLDKPKRGNKKERREREKRKIERRKAREKNKKK